MIQILKAPPDIIYFNNNASIRFNGVVLLIWLQPYEISVHSDGTLSHNEVNVFCSIPRIQRKRADCFMAVTNACIRC